MLLTDGGIETTLIFDDGLELPEFAAFTLLDHEPGKEALDRCFRTYAELAGRHGCGIVLETPTWRANPDWAARLGYSVDELADRNRRAVALVQRAQTETAGPVVVSGCMGPRGDGYIVADPMTVNAAHRYHSIQIRTIADAGADVIGAITTTYAEEAAGVALAAGDAGMAVAISFTVETDGRLPTGQPLGEAITAVDTITDGHPAYYMINCAHPTHFTSLLTTGELWVTRLRGIRANASTLSHAELDAADHLDTGDPADLAARYAQLRHQLPQLTVLGGCCGTKTHHIDAIACTCVTTATVT